MDKQLLDLYTSLGFDPDEAQEETVERLQNLANEAGQDAIAEIAPACSGVNPEATLKTVMDFAHSAGISGRIQPTPSLRQFTRKPEFQHSTPWHQ